MEPEIIRFNPEKDNGLTSKQVEERIQQKLINKTKSVVTKTYAQIFVDNVLNFFNVLLFVIAILLIIAQRYTSLFFLVVLIPNIVIGLYEDIHARRLMDKLNLITDPKTTVVRDGKHFQIPVNQLVLDDIIELNAGAQISADSILVSGNLLVNEALLTGESLSISKGPGDLILSGSFVVSGSACARVDKIGEESYVQSLQASAKKFKRSPSKVLKSLKTLFRYIGIIVITLGVSMLVIYGIHNAFSSYESFKNIMGPISGSMISMIPSGLYLLTSVALATAVIKLSKHQARVQDFYSVEMLARTDLLCVDKTGTITDGTMNVYKIIPFGSNGEATVAGILSAFSFLSEDNNFTMNSLREYFKNSTNTVAIEKLGFTSENKYSAMTFSSGTTYVLGAAECINLVNKNGILHRVEEYSSKGYRVLVLAKNNIGIKDGKVDSNSEAVGMVVLQDHIRPDAIKTFKWFKDNGVGIKVISGDDAQTVSEIARQAGIENADNYISLAGMSLEEVNEIANNYSVFGRVSPEQKEVLINSFKEAGHTVAMTGDGVNDILALKRADCSIAMASGSEAAKNVSHIVLLDSNFDHLPMVVDQGRRVINNLQRTGSLFLVKTIFAVALTTMFLVASIFNKQTHYPFEANNLFVWEITCIGFSSFFLALEPNSESIKGSFFGNIFKKAIPGAIACVVSVVIIFGLYHLQKYNLLYTGIYDNPNYFLVETNKPVIYMAARCMSSIVFTLISVFVLLKICLPFTKYRAIVFAISAAGNIGGLVFEFIFSYNNMKDIFMLDFTILNPINYFVTAIVAVSIITLYMFSTYIVEVFKGEYINVNNKSRSE